MYQEGHKDDRKHNIAAVQKPCCLHSGVWFRLLHLRNYIAEVKGRREQ